MLNLKTVEFFYIIIFKNSDTEYRKLLSGTYEYEYEEYSDEDNFVSNTPQDTTTTIKTSLGSAKKASTRSNISPTTLLKLPILQKCQQQNLLNTI